MIGSQLAVFWLAWRYLIQPACGLYFRDYTGSMARPLLTTCLAVSASVATAAIVPDTWRLAAGGTAFALAYLLLSLWLNPEWLRMSRELLDPIRPPWSSR